MNGKSLEDRAIDIKGKQYVLVSDRVIYFNENYPNGSIVTELVSQTEDQLVVIKAIVTPDTDKPERKFVDYSQAKWGDGFINKTSAMENCSTSAVGRALAYMGIGVIDSIASVDEINKAGYKEQARKIEPQVDELIKSKQSLFEQFKAHDLLTHEDITGFIQSVLQKDTIDSVLDSKRVLKALEMKADEELENA